MKCAPYVSGFLPSLAIYAPTLARATRGCFSRLLGSLDRRSVKQAE
jgi:hypothetical protein